MIRDSRPKGPRFYTTYCQNGDPDVIHATPTLSPSTKWQHQKSNQFLLPLHSPDGSTTTSTATQLSQFKVYDTFYSTKSMPHFHSTKPARACAQTIGAAICAYALSTRKCNYASLIFR
ncbi:hypothetical protein AVEN_55825-1 [Araneus ventricosus]|uniref:Uncharacterized protein n=1 Tax=Araneus ventricosus TaxID=182803 RepID=A0A4Y2CMT4_ARAVE|nr:hypothetical protein AVEN_55825-1 [Araneus ventricosus]